MYFRTRVQIPAPPFITSLGGAPLTFPTSLRARGRLRRLPSGPRLRPQAPDGIGCNRRAFTIFLPTRPTRSFSRSRRLPYSSTSPVDTDSPNSGGSGQDTPLQNRLRSR